MFSYYFLHLNFIENITFEHLDRIVHKYVRLFVFLYISTLFWEVNATKSNIWPMILAWKWWFVCLCCEIIGYSWLLRQKSLRQPPVRIMIVPHESCTVTKLERWKDCQSSIKLSQTSLNFFVVKTNGKPHLVPSYPCKVLHIALVGHLLGTEERSRVWRVYC